MPVILYNAYIFYINMNLKKYSYLSLFNSDKYNDRYKFKNLGLYSRCKKEYNKEKIIS